MAWTAPKKAGISVKTGKAVNTVTGKVVGSTSSNKSNNSSSSNSASAIAKAKDDWLAATTQEGRDAAHAEADAVRGYTTDASGSYATTIPATNSNSNSYGSNKASTTPNNITTNTSYNGNYLTVDLNKDYTTDMANAKASGDYASAAQAEALRNAKINYLDSIGANTGGYKTTNEYTNVYTSSNGNGTNNQGGTVYTNTATKLADLPTGWTKAQVNGQTYTQDASGIYELSGKDVATGNDNYSLIGNKLNPTTGEAMFTNQDDARKAAYNSYIGSGGTGSYDYVNSKGLIDENYVSALQNGTAGTYNSDTITAAKEKQKEEEDELAAAINSYTKDEEDENSFESDLIETPIVTATTDTSAADLAAEKQAAYDKYVLEQIKKARYNRR